jgi:hypothetical protein
MALIFEATSSSTDVSIAASTPSSQGHCDRKDCLMQENEFSTGPLWSGLYGGLNNGLNPLATNGFLSLWNATLSSKIVVPDGYGNPTTKPKNRCLLMEP